MKRTTHINLFAYLDYRKFLVDWYQEAKKARGSYSFRTFSKKAGFTSPNFFKLVMDGERNLTEESLSKFIVGLGLNKQEQDFFRNLVFFTQAKSHEDKDRYYQRLLQSRKFGELKPIEKERYDFYATWYHPVIRELVTSKDFDGSPEWLAHRISPAITPAEAKKSMDLLQRLGFIRKKENGSWGQDHPLVTTGAEVSSLVLMNYHHHLLELTQERIKKLPAADRDISSLTLGTSAAKLAVIKKKIQEFRQDILKLVSTDTEPEKVVLLNIQFFPVTNNKEES